MSASHLRVFQLVAKGLLDDIFDVKRLFRMCDTRNTRHYYDAFLIGVQSGHIAKSLDLALKGGSGLHFFNELTREQIPVATASEVMTKHPYFVNNITYTQLKALRSQKGKAAYPNPPHYLRNERNMMALRGPTALWYHHSDPTGTGKTQPPYNDDRSLRINGVTLRPLTEQLLASLEATMSVVSASGERSIREAVAGTGSSSSIAVTWYYAPFCLSTSITDKSLRENINEFRKFAGKPVTSAFEGTLHLSFDLTLNFEGGTSQSIEHTMPVPLFLRSEEPAEGVRDYSSRYDKQVRDYLLRLAARRPAALSSPSAASTVSIRSAITVASTETVSGTTAQPSPQATSSAATTSASSYTATNDAGATLPGSGAIKRSRRQAGMAPSLEASTSEDKGRRRPPAPSTSSSLASASASRATFEQFGIVFQDNQQGLIPELENQDDEHEEATEAVSSAASSVASASAPPSFDGLEDLFKPDSAEDGADAAVTEADLLSGSVTSDGQGTAVSVFPFSVASQPSLTSSSSSRSAAAGAGVQHFGSKAGGARDWCFWSPA
jgi:hypothetical protein